MPMRGRPSYAIDDGEQRGPPRVAGTEGEKEHAGVWREPSLAPRLVQREERRRAARVAEPLDVRDDALRCERQRRAEASQEVRIRLVRHDHVDLVERDGVSPR